MALEKKKLFILIPVALVLLVGLVEGGRVWWYRGYSNGSRTGVVRKISIKGPPYCKYFSGELALQGAGPGQQPEIWEFSIDGEDSEKNPLVANLKAAEKSGERVTLNYRQDLKALFRCSPSEYFVGSLEK
jgi:hypothetical protein